MERRRTLGKSGEEFAANLLKKRGYRIHEKNYRCPLGEIDIIALDGKILVFVEVRTKTSLQFGSGADSITRKKQNKLKKLALYYITTKKLTKMDCRFDVVAVQTSASGFTADLYKNAFF